MKMYTVNYFNALNFCVPSQTTKQYNNANMKILNLKFWFKKIEKKKETKTKKKKKQKL